MRSATARIAAVFAVLLALSMLTACGGSADRHGAPSGTGQSSEQADHNADDVAFAHNMIPHLEQAVQMAQMVPTNTTNPQVIALAGRITTTQGPLVQAFRAFLTQWQDVQGRDAAGQGIPMVGMVEATTMDKLQSLTGPGFDRLWLTSMIDHHRGAITMAQDEVAHGRSADVIYLARSIIATQQPEIDQMNRMLGG
jgi:uncharacterized protein (DUF305 family)